MKPRPRSEQPCLSPCWKIKHTPTNRKNDGLSWQNMTYVMLSQGGKLTLTVIKYRLNQRWVSKYLNIGSQSENDVLE